MPVDQHASVGLNVSEKLSLVDLVYRPGEDMEIPSSNPESSSNLLCGLSRVISYSLSHFFISVRKQCLLASQGHGEEGHSGGQKENELIISRSTQYFWPAARKETRRYWKTQHMYGQNQRLVVVRKKREQCLILTFTHSKPVFQAVLLQPTLLVGARSRGKIPESRFWQRLPLNLQRIKFVFFSFSFFF